MSNHYFLYLYVLGMDARTMLNGVTYSKSLRLSNKARQVFLLFPRAVFSSVLARPRLFAFGSQPTKYAIDRFRLLARTQRLSFQ